MKRWRTDKRNLLIG